MCSDLDTPYILDADGKPTRVPEYEEVGRRRVVVDTEEAKVVEEELELVIDWAVKDNQQIETADADGKSRGVPGHEEVGHSIEVVSGN